MIVKSIHQKTLLKSHKPVLQIDCIIINVREEVFSFSDGVDSYGLGLFTVAYQAGRRDLRER